LGLFTTNDSQKTASSSSPSTPLDPAKETDPLPSTETVGSYTTDSPSLTISRREVLVGHCLSTKVLGEIVTDNSMSLPPEYDPTSSSYTDPLATRYASSSIPPEQRRKPAKSEKGHQEEGLTIGLHSLAVHPDFQRQGYGTILLKDYIARMKNAATADRISLIAHKEFIPYYEGFGFRNRGESKATFGGGGWYDMVLPLKGGDDNSSEEDY
jgi:ribosomal protein S18 acetylase RimI-like enzyme